MEGVLRRSAFKDLEQSTCPLVDKLSVPAAQLIIRYFVFCTSVTMLYPWPVVSSLLVVMVVQQTVLNC